MRYASVCSGIGAPECAWSSLGWHCEFAAEIEAFPSAVYTHHFPKVPNYGDITKFKEWPQHAIDILVGGTPCQSFSVAGLRKGMADPRGNLALTFLAIVGKYAPTWVVWENVPGVLSIDEGRAFGSFLGGLAELGYGFAYRVLDAQYFGVAQRRRRVFVVGHAGGQWQRASAVLFERESLCGNSAPRRETGKRVAPTISSRTKGGGGLGTDVDCDGGLVARPILGKANSSHDETQETYIAHSLRADGFDASEDGTGSGTPLVPEVSPAMKSRDYKGPSSDGDGDGDGLPLIAFNCKDHGADASELAPTLRACPHDKSHANSGAPPAIAFHQNQRAEVTTNDTVGALNSGGGKPGQGYPAIAFKPNQGSKSRSIGASDKVSPTLEAAMGGNNKPAVQSGFAVRRLTPTECERLQGFPDGYTAIQYRGKPACDGPRYKALGNSMAVPVLRWIGQRIELVHAL